MINFFKDLKEQIYIKLFILGFIICIVIFQPTANTESSTNINVSTIVEITDDSPLISIDRKQSV